MELIELRLTGIAYGGNAVGRHNGRVVFVPNGIPGDFVRARITQEKERFAVADIVEILEASNQRIQPRCTHFGVCGGCHWQHMTYAAQLDYKRQIVEEQMSRIGGLQDVKVPSVIPSAIPWDYRSHATFHIIDNQWGFVGADNHSLIPIRECHIIQPEIAALLSISPGDKTSTNRLRVQVGSGGESCVFPVGGADDTSLTSTADHTKAVYYSVGGRSFRCSPGSFFQVNVPQAEMLVSKVLEYLHLDGHENVLELYSGVGLFTAFLAASVKQVTAIEISKFAIQDAQFNLAQFRNVKLLTGKVEKVLGYLGRKDYDVVVLDPPRSGVAKIALKALISCNPRQIVYVSCDVATLARDAKRLAEANYDLLEVQPVDMFPQTYHIECVAYFVKRKTQGQ